MALLHVCALKKCSKWALLLVIIKTYFVKWHLKKDCCGNSLLRLWQHLKNPSRKWIIT